MAKSEAEILEMAAQILADRRRNSGEFISAMIRSAAHRSRERARRDSQWLIFGSAGQIKARAAQRAREGGGRK